VDLPLRRPTAALRRTLGWVQLILAVGVVLAAVVLGHLVQSRVEARAAGTTARQEVVTPTAESSVTGGGATGDGSLAALGTLLVGATLVACIGTVGRRRLDDSESDRWASDWARVEPVWSGRVTEGF
jgi:hypothetical protein